MFVFVAHRVCVGRRLRDVMCGDAAQMPEPSPYLSGLGVVVKMMQGLPTFSLHSQ